METTMSRDFAKIIAKAWIDPSFKEQLMQDPAAVLSEYGITMPEGMDLSNFKLPHAPVERVREMNLEIHNCPEESSYPHPGVMDRVHDQSLTVVACPQP